MNNVVVENYTYYCDQVLPQKDYNACNIENDISCQSHYIVTYKCSTSKMRGCMRYGVCAYKYIYINDRFIILNYPSR